MRSTLWMAMGSCAFGPAMTCALFWLRLPIKDVGFRASLPRAYSIRFLRRKRWEKDRGLDWILCAGSSRTDTAVRFHSSPSPVKHYFSFVCPLPQANDYAQPLSSCELSSPKAPLSHGDGPRMARIIATRLLLAEAGSSLVQQDAHHSGRRTHRPAGMLL